MRRILFLGAALFAAFAYADTPQVPTVAQYGANLGNYPISQVKGCAVTCGSSATSLTCSASFTVRWRVVSNTGTKDVYVSAADVTSSAGYLLQQGKDLNIPVDSQAATALVLKCAVSGGGGVVSVIEGG